VIKIKIRPGSYSRNNSLTLKALGYTQTNLTLELLNEETPRIFQVDEDGFMV
jgi:hypothetical protein